MYVWKKISTICIAVIISLVFLWAQKTHASFSFSLATEGSDFALQGANIGEQFGTTMATADLNGDGRDELIVGSPFYSAGNNTANGKVTIFLSNNEEKNISRSKLFAAKRSIGIIGKTGSTLGTALATGDMNGDGFMDLAIGAPNTENGNVYILFGRQNLRPYEASIDKVALAVFEGPLARGKFGFSIATADFNADNIDDLAIGAPGITHGGAKNSGRVFAFLGRHMWGPKYPRKGSLEYQPNFVVFNSKANEQFGSALHTIDANNDGNDDIVVATPQADAGEKNAAGRVDIFFGGGISPYALFVRNAGEADQSIIGDEAEKRFGLDFATGDFNADGIEDIAISSVQGNIELISKESLKKAAYGTSVRRLSFASIAPEGNMRFFGTALQAFDVDRDGIQDLLIGVPMRTEGKRIGEVVAVFGKEKWSGERDLKKTPADMEYVGLREGEWFGSEIQTGDFDGDGYQDVVIAAPVAGEEKKTGAINGMFGGRSWKSVITEKRNAQTKVTRGLFLARLFQELDIEKRYEGELQRCRENFKLCFFAFSLKSRFSGISFQPFQLYPDVPPNHQFAEVINKSSMVGLVQGSQQQEGSPFRPDKSIARIHALKVLAEALNIIDWKEQSEVAGEESSISFIDIDPGDSARFWYPRYLDAAQKNSLIDAGKVFRPEEPLLRFELEEWLRRAKNVQQQVLKGPVLETKRETP